MDMLAYFLGRLANSGPISSDEEINDFIQELPDDLGSVNDTITGKATELKVSETAFFEEDGKLIALCENEVWNLDLDKAYLYGRRLKDERAGKYVRGVFLKEDADGTRYIEVEGTKLRFFKAGTYNDTYMSFDDPSKVQTNSGTLKVGNVMSLVLTEVEL